VGDAGSTLTLASTYGHTRSTHMRRKQDLGKMYIRITKTPNKESLVLARPCCAIVPLPTTVRPVPPAGQFPWPVSHRTERCDRTVNAGRHDTAGVRMGSRGPLLVWGRDPSGLSVTLGVSSALSCWFSLALSRGLCWDPPCGQEGCEFKLSTWHNLRILLHDIRCHFLKHRDHRRA
jgi:hypothetical protein